MKKFSPHSKRAWGLFGMVLSVGLFPFTLYAGPITSLGDDTSGGFGFSYLHSAENITNGSTKEKLVLIDDGSNFVNTTTGALRIKVGFKDGSPSGAEAIGTSTGLDLNKISDATETEDTIGTITWTLNDVAKLHFGLLSNTVTMEFIDTIFTSGSIKPNTWVPNANANGDFRLTLWGADGLGTGANSYPYGYSGSTLGADLVIYVDPVPEPTTLLLGAVGLGLVVAVVRRRERVKA